MNSSKHYLMVMISCFCSVNLSCGGVTDRPKSAGSGLITTPPTYYSTPKAKYLGERYNGHLDRMVEQIVRNPKTSTLQFANNIATVGGIGFFTHSATKTPDERYLEVVLGVPDTFQVKGEQSAKVLQIFSTYGLELLTILAADPAIYQEKEVTGYGLNFSWRSVVATPAGSRVIIERGVVYAAKEKVRSFLSREIKSYGLLEEAVIFAAEEDAPLQLVSYRPVEAPPDYRLPRVQEETIIAQREGPKAALKGTPPGARLREAKVERPAAKEQVTPPASDPNLSPLPRTAAAQKTKPSVPLPEAKSVEKHSESPESRIKDASQNQVSQGPLPKDVEASGASNPAKEMKRGATKDQGGEPTSVANTAEPAVKIPAQNKPSGAAAVVSLTERSSAQPANASSSAGAESAKADNVVERKPAAPSQVNEKVAESLTGSQIQQNRQPKAKTVSTAVENAKDGYSLPASIDEKSKRSQPDEGQGRQQVAMKRASGPTSAELSGLRSAVSRSLEGYIIQLSFAEKVEARRWAETLQRRGHTVSMTEAGGAGIRVRIGSFSQRKDAEQQLQKLRQDGLSGIVLNLPQGYRPETSSAPQEVTKTGAVAQ